MANAARHRKAVQLTLATTDDTVTLSIIDNGQGFDTTQDTHMGIALHSMQERMKALEGSLRIESVPGKITHIIAHCKRLLHRSQDETELKI